MTRYRIATVTAPTLEPLLLAEVKQQRRLQPDDHSEDGLLWSLMRAAREHLGGRRGLTGYALATATYDLFMDWWPACGYITVPLPPLQSVTWLKYTDSDATITTVSSSIYTVDTASEPGRLVLNYGEVWPTATLANANPINIRFVAGFDPAGNNGIPQTPEPLKQAMHLLIGHWYENREATADPLPKAIDMAVDALIANWTAEHVF